MSWPVVLWLVSPFVFIPICECCDSSADRELAKSRGWRTFRVRAVTASGIEPMGEREIVCPASAEGGHRVSCDTCGLCAGASRQAKDIAIINHSTSARAAVKRLTVISA